MTNKIKQAVAKVVFSNGSYYWIRISRAYLSSLAYYWRKKNGFKYMKIYEIKGYKKGTQHAIGIQIGYITLKGSKLDVKGLTETNESVDYKRRNRL